MIWSVYDELTGVFDRVILVNDVWETIAPKLDPASLLVFPAGIRFPGAVIAASIVNRHADLALHM